jgi:hypothetical protein
VDAVAEVDGAAAEPPLVQQFEPHRCLHRQRPPAAADRDRDEDEADLVDEAGRQRV